MTYKGEVKNDKPHGKGTYIWHDGNKYIGQFEKGKRHGSGTMTWPNGVKYTGEWKDGEVTSNGKCYNHKGESVECNN